MGADEKIVMGMRAVALMAALAVIGLGAWAQVMVHDVEAREASMLRLLPQDPESIVQFWRGFFTAITDGTARIWICIAAGCLAFLVSLLVLLSTLLRRLQIPGSVRIPLELLSMVSISIAFGCALSYALHLGTFSTTSLETPDDDFEQFIMVITLSQGLVVSSGIGVCILLITSINAMVHSCIKARANNSCSFEPSASALGMGQETQAIVPPVSRSRPPTLYVPHKKPMPKHLERMPETDDEKAMADEFAWLTRVATNASNGSRNTFDIEKQEIRPLNPRKSVRVTPVRPARPWSAAPMPQNSPGIHAL